MAGCIEFYCVMSCLVSCCGRLIDEVKDLNRSVEALVKELEAGQNALKNMLDTRAALEDALRIKTNTAFIERQKVLALRPRYPTTLKLQGY